MLEKIMDLLNFAYRQKYAFFRIGDIFSSIFEGGFHPKRLLALITAFLEIIPGIADRGLTPLGRELDLSGYSLVFCEEFDGDELDTSAWYYRGLGTRRAGYTGKDQVKLENGNLVITAEYKNGEYGEGWYAGKIGTVKKYRNGYFEIRCKCNDGGEIWSAFWTMPANDIDPYSHETSKGGVGGAELDIFEAPFANEKGGLRNSVTQTIHCNGGDDDPEKIDSRCLGRFKADKDIYSEYNTYGLEWTEDEYIFYINGVETARSSFENGVCEVEQEIIVSLELPDEITFDHDHSTQFVVDYVKIWQM